MSMSTPIANIPIASGKSDEDPEVVELLNEMNSSIPSIIHREVPKNTVTKSMYYEPHKPYFHIETAQKALYMAAIAFIIFYPNILDPIYAKFPMFNQLQDNELVVRSALLGVVVYIILWKFNLIN